MADEQEPGAVGDDAALMDAFVLPGMAPRNAPDVEPALEPFGGMPERATVAPEEPKDEGPDYLRASTTGVEADDYEAGIIERQQQLEYAYKQNNPGANDDEAMTWAKKEADKYRFLPPYQAPDTTIEGRAGKGLAMRVLGRRVISMPEPTEPGERPQAAMDSQIAERDKVTRQIMSMGPAEAILKTWSGSHKPMTLDEANAGGLFLEEDLRATDNELMVGAGVGGALGLASAGTLIAKGVAEGAPMGPWGMAGMAAANLAMGSAIGYFGTGVGKSYDAEDFWSASDNPLYESDDGEFRIVVAKGLQNLSGRAQSKLGIWDAASTTMGLVSDDWSKADKKRMDRQIENAAPGQEFNALVSMSDHIDSLAEEGLKANDPKMKQAREQFAVTYLSLPKVSLTKQILDDYKIDVERSIRTKWPKKTQDWVDRQVDRLTTVSPLRLKRVMTAQPLLEDREDLKFLNRVIGKLKAGASDEDLQKALDTVPVWELAEAGLLIGEVKSDGKSVAMAAFPTPYHVSVTGAVKDSSEIQEATGTKTSAVMERAFGELMLKRVKDSHELGRINVVEGNVGRAMRLMGGATDLFMEAPFGFAGIDRAYGLGIRPEGASYTENVLGAVSSGMSGVTWNAMASMHRAGWDRESAAYKWALGGAVAADFLAPWEEMSVAVPITAMKSFHRMATIPGRVLPKGSPKGKMRAAMVSPPAYRAYHKLVHGKENAPVYGDTYAVVEHVIDSMIRENIISGKMHGKEVPKLIESQMEVLAQRLGVEGGFDALRSKVEGVSEKTFGSMLESIHDIMENGTPVSRGLRSSDGYQATLAQINKAAKDGRLTNTHAALYMGLLEIQAMRHSQNPDLPDIQTPEDFFKKVQHRYGPDTGPPIAGPGPGPKPGPKPGRKPRPKAKESFKLEKENVELAEKAVKKAKAKLAKLIEASKKAQAVKEPTPEPTIKGGKDLEAAIEAKDAADDAVVKAKKALSDEKAKLSVAEKSVGDLKRKRGVVDVSDSVFLEGLWAAPKIMKEDAVDLILSHLGSSWKRVEGLSESDGQTRLGRVPEQIGVFVNDNGDAVLTPVLGGRYGGLGYFVKPPDGISATALMEQGHLPTMGIGKIDDEGLQVWTKAGEVPAGGNSLIQAKGYTLRPARLEGRKKKVDAAIARVTQAEMDLNDANRAAEAADVAVTRATEAAAPVEATTDVAELPPPTVGKTEPERVAIAKARSEHERVGRGIIDREFSPEGELFDRTYREATGGKETKLEADQVRTGISPAIRENMGDAAGDAFDAEIAILRDFELKKSAESSKVKTTPKVTEDVAESPAIKAAQEDLSKLERRLQKAQSSLSALRDGLAFEMPKVSSRPLGFDDITDLAQEVGVDPYSPAFKDKLGELGFDGIPVEQRSISQVYALLQSGHFGGDVEAFVPPNFVDGFMPADWVGGRFSLPDGTTVYAVKDGNGRIVGRGDTSIEAVSQAVAMAEMMDPGTKFRSPIDTTPSSVGPIHVSMEIADVESAMIGAKIEYGVHFDAETGQQIGRFSGDTGSITIDPRFIVAAMVHGNLVFTHNHPLGLPFSPADIVSAVCGNFAEIRAVSSIDGTVFSLKRPNGGWGERFDFSDLMREDPKKAIEAFENSTAVKKLDSALKDLSETAMLSAVVRMSDDILNATGDLTRSRKFVRVSTRWVTGDYGSGAKLSEQLRGEPVYNAETFSRYLTEEAIKNIDRALEAAGIGSKVETVGLGQDVAPGSGVVTPIDPVLRAAQRAGVESDIPGATFKSLFGDLFKSKPKKVDEVPDVVEPDVAAKIDDILEVLEESGVILTPGKLGVDLDRMNKMKEAGGLAVETKGELGMDKARMISLLGASMYRGDIGEITVKELVQNSFDGLKAAQHSGQIKPGEGRIDVDVDLDDFSITVADNGSGMTPETVQKAFFTIGGTDKGGLPPSMRSGGLGMAKMAFLFSAKRIELTTIRNGTKTTVVTTPESIQTDSFTIRQEPTDEPSGTVVKIVLPREIEDLHTGDAKAIHLSPAGTHFVHEPMIGDVKLTQNVIRGGIKSDYSPRQGVDFDIDANPKLTSAAFDWGSADIYMSVERTQYPAAHILSSGLYQFKWWPRGLQRALPFNIIVDIKPDVDPTHAHYPFNQQREGFRGTIQEDVKALAAYLIRHGFGLEAEATAGVFENTVSMERVDLKDMLDDIETRRPAPRAVPKLEPELDLDEARRLAKLDIVITDGSVEVGGRTVLTRKEVENVANAKESFKADKAGKSASSFFDTVKVDPKKPLFHNNTNMEIPESAHQMMAKLGTVVLEFRERLAKIPGYEGLDNLDSPYASGLSLDKSYHGVHVKVPYKAFFLNPLATRAKKSDGVVGGWVHTLIHEGAHFKDMTHDEPWAVHLADLHMRLADSGDDLIIREALTQVLDNHWDDFFELRSEYERSTTTNVAKPLEAGSKLPTDEDVRLRSRVSGARSGEVQDGGRPSRGVDEGLGRGPEDDPGATGATVIDAIHANLVGGRGVEAPAQRAPHQMTQSEYLSEYVPLNRRVEAAEKTPERRMSPEESELMTEDWEAYSRSRGYTESEIADLRRLMELHPTHRFPQEYASDAGMHWDHVRVAIREGKAVPAEVLEDYPELARTSRRKNVDIGRDYIDKRLLDDPYLEFDTPRWVEDQIDEGASTPRLAAAQRLKKILRLRNEGKISEVYASELLEQLARQMDEVKEFKTQRGDRAEVVRGADIVMEKLIRARRRNEIEPGVVDLALWLIDKNPDIAEGLAISIRRYPKEMRPEIAAGTVTAAQYNIPRRLITLFKKGPDQGAPAVHEILHHTERMMPVDVQAGIRRAWAAAITRELKTATPEQSALLEKMLRMEGTYSGEIKQGFKSGVLDSSKHYHLVNPSEFWAVNASRIIEGRYAATGGWVATAKQWLTELIEKIKGLLGVQSDAAVLRGLKDVLAGDGTFVSRMLLDRPGASQATKTVPMAPTPRAPGALTDTPEFKAWSGGAPVIKLGDDLPDGPVVVEVYHGAAHSKGFESFELELAGSASLDSGWYGKGFYFSDNPSVASVYAGGGIRLDTIEDSVNAAGFAPTSGTGSIAPVYVLLRNPYDVGPKPFGVRGLVRAGQRLPDDIHAAVVAKVGFDPSAAKNPFRAGESKTGEAGAKVVRDYLKSAGFPDYWANERVKSYLENPDGFWFRLGEGTMSIDALTRALKADGFDGILQREANAGRVTLPWADWGVRTTGDAEALFSDAMTATLKEQGYDGVVASLSPVGGREYMVFEPTQIKSVKNRGTFDPADPRILYSGPRAPEAPAAATLTDNTKDIVKRIDERHAEIEKLQAENARAVGPPWPEEVLKRARKVQLLIREGFKLTKAERKLLHQQRMAVKDAFEAMGKIQRGAPEYAGQRVRSAFKDSATGFADPYGQMVEDIGDLTHRMGHYAHGSISQKVSGTLGGFGDWPGLDSVYSDNVSSNKILRYAFGQAKEHGGYTGSYETFVDTLRVAGQEYAEAHRTVPVYNELHRLANDAAIALGEFRFKDARKHLEKLEGYLDEGSDAFEVRASRVEPEFARPGGPAPRAPGASAAATLTDEFKSWFGRSKVVDEAGEPMVYYHGIPREVKPGDFVFRSSPTANGLIYFDSRPKIASAYATGKRAGYLSMNESEFAVEIKVAAEHNPDLFSDGVLRQDIKKERLEDFLWSVQTPGAEDILAKLDANEISATDAIKSYNDYVTETKNPPGSVIPVYLRVENPYNTPETALSFRQAEKLGAEFFQKAGADGVYVRESGEAALAVFEPNQIKSKFNRKPTDDPRILYSGPPEAPKGTFEIDANTGRMLIRLFETGDIGTLFHENGHLLEALLGAKWRDELFKHYETEITQKAIDEDVKAGRGSFSIKNTGRRLSRAGSEQLAQAFKAYLETRVGPGGPVKRKFVELYRTMQDMWLRTRNQPETLPPEMLALFDGYFRPTDVAMDGAVGLTAAVFDGRMPTVHLDSDLATRLSEGKVREAQQKMSWERIDILDEHVRQATGITEDITEMSAVDLYARLYAYVATEQSRKLAGPMGLTSITDRTHVPTSRLKQVQAEIRDRLSYYNQARPKDVAAQVTRITRDGRHLYGIELEVIELNDAQAAGFKRMVEDIAGEPMGNIIFSRMLDPEYDYSNPTPIEYNVVIEAMKDVVSGPGGRKTGYSEKISPSMGYAIWNAFKSGANRLSDEAGVAGFKGTRDFLKKWFNVEHDVAHLDPIVRSLIQARMRGISDAPDWARRRAMRVAKEVRASKTGDSEGMNVHVEILNDLREALEWPIHPSKVWLDGAEVSPLLEMHKRFERIHRAEVERARLWDKERPDRFPNPDEYADLTTEELFADLDQIKAMLREEGVRLPDNVAAAVDVLEIYKKRLRATPVDELGESQQFELGGAIDEIYYALQGKVDTVVEKAADMATSITGSEGSGIHGAMSLDQQMQLYSWFYSGQFEKMIDFVSQRGFHTGLEKQKMSRLDMSEVMLEMIIRMKAQQEFNGLLEDLTRYHLRFDVRDLGSEKDFGPNFDRTAFAERVKHYLKSQVGGDRSIRQMWAQGGKAGLEAPVAPDPSIYPPRDRVPGPIDSSPVRRLHDMRAYFKAMEIIDRWGVGSFVGAWDTFKFPDGTEVFIPVEAKVALQDAIDRAAGVGATYGRTTLGKKFLPERKGLPTKDPGISERLERTRGVKATSAVAKALNWLFYMNPLTAARIKMGITTGVIVPNAPYYVGVGIGALFQMYQGLGATATVKALFKNPRMTTAVIARLFKDGGYRPNAPAMVTPDGRIYTADMLADMAQRYSLNQSFVKAETVGSVADDITNMTPDGVVERISSGFGRWQDTLVESTTALDNFFRVSTFLHELEAGASPKAAASLARKVGFDYSELSEFERKSCRDVILFYSYMRKNQDLFWDTMLTNPSRVIGQIRLVRGLQQANVEDDAEIVIPDHLKTRLPVYFRDTMEQTHVNRQTMWITPPLPFADAVNLYVDLFGTVESATSSAKNPDPIRATMARLTPWVQFPFIMAFHKDLFFDRDLDKINRVPSVFIEADYMLTGGMISEDLLDVTDQPKYDPMTETVPGFGFYHAQNGKAWWILTKFLQVPGFGRSMSVLESLDRANTGAVEVPLKAAKAFRMYGVREGFLDYPKPKNFKLPSDLSEDIAGPRHYNELSGFDEFMGFMGIRPVPITKENVRWAQLIRRHGYDLKDQVKKDEQSDMYKRR